MEIKYQLIESEKLFIQRLEGYFEIEKYMQYMSYIYPRVAKLDVEKVLLDYRDLSFGNFTECLPENFENNMALMINARTKFDKYELKDHKIELAIWIDKPIPSAIMHLFTQNFPQKNYRFCTTEEKVIKELQIPSMLDEIENIILKLEHTY